MTRYPSGVASRRRIASRTRAASILRLTDATATRNSTPRPRRLASTMDIPSGSGATGTGASDATSAAPQVAVCPSAAQRAPPQTRRGQRPARRSSSHSGLVAAPRRGFRRRRGRCHWVARSSSQATSVSIAALPITVMPEAVNSGKGNDSILTESAAIESVSKRQPSPSMSRRWRALTRGHRVGGDVVERLRRPVITVMRSHSTDSGAIPMLRWIVGTPSSASRRIRSTPARVSAQPPSLST
jgi:hypothetical protein